MDCFSYFLSLQRGPASKSTKNLRWRVSNLNRSSEISIQGRSMASEVLFVLLLMLMFSFIWKLLQISYKNCLFFVSHSKKTTVYWEWRRRIYRTRSCGHWARWWIVTSDGPLFLQGLDVALRDSYICVLNWAFSLLPPLQILVKFVES